MNILVTGGAGFIGSSITQRLLDRGDRVVVFDNFDDFYNPTIKRLNISRFSTSKNFHLAEGDIRDRNKLKQAFSSLSIDAVIHCAARAGVRPSLLNPELYEDVNVKGTMYVLEMVREYKVKNTVFCSSSSVYGNNQKVPFSESDNVDHPISPYAATKRAGELLCYTYHYLYDLNITCLRLFTAYGPRQRPEMAIHQFTRRIDLGMSLSMFGDGHTSRDYTYIDDVTDGIVKAVDKPLGYKVINLGESSTIRLSDLISTIERELGKKADIRHLPAQPGDVERTYADIGNARRLLGYNPIVTISEGVERFVEWYKNEGRAWLPLINERA